MSTTNEPNFDWSQAASLLGDEPDQVPEDMVEIARELVDGAEGQFQDLKSRNVETERTAIASLAHQLRGCLLNFGFTEVGSILLHVEKGTYAPAEYPALVAKAYDTFLVSKKMLGQRYPSLGF